MNPAQPVTRTGAFSVMVVGRSAAHGASWPSSRVGAAAPGVAFHGMIAAEARHARILRGFAGILAAKPAHREQRVSAILVVRPSSLGDIVHALTLVADVRAHRPELAIDWVAETGFVPLLELHPGLRRIVPVAFRGWRQRPFAASSWREFASFRHALRREKYVAVLDLQEQVKGALIARMARGVRHGPDRLSIREPVASIMHDMHHAIDPHQHLIVRCRELAAAALGYRVEGPPRFGLVPPLPVAGTVPDRPFVTFFHGTSRPDKLWPDAHWRRLVEMFTASGFLVVLPWGSDAEHARSERFAAGVPDARVPPSPRQSLPALAALLARAELVIGVDTGLVHLSATDPRSCGVRLAGPWARDLGGIDGAPTPEMVERTAAELMRSAPRC